MPTYIVRAPAGQLSAEQKAKIAKGVTDTHERVTGAQCFFTEVIFHDVPDGNWFMGGRPLAMKQYFIEGHIRGGRPAAMTGKLVLGMRDVLADATGAPMTSIWSYLIELSPELMVEYGHVLPQAGREAEWLDGMPQEDRQLLEAMGRSIPSA